MYLFYFVERLSEQQDDWLNKCTTCLADLKTIMQEWISQSATYMRPGWKKQPGICGDVHTQQWKGVAREKCAVKHVWQKKWLVHDIDFEHVCSEFYLLHHIRIKINKSRFLLSFCIVMGLLPPRNGLQE